MMLTTAAPRQDPVGRMLFLRTDDDDDNSAIAWFYIQLVADKQF